MGQEVFRSLIFGAVISIVMVIGSVSYAALVFSAPMLQEFFIVGINGAIICCMVLLMVVSSNSSSVSTIAGTQDTYAIFSALTAMNLVSLAGANSSPHALLPTVIAALMLMSLTMGLMMYLMGLAKLGKLIRFVPFPVIGGFMAGTGLLFVFSAAQLMTRQSLASFDWHILIKLPWNWLLPFSYACLMVFLARRFFHFLVFPGLFLFSIVAFYVFLWMNHYSLHAAREFGWMIGPFPKGSLLKIPSLLILEGVRWDLLIYFIPDFFTLAFLGIISLLLNMSSFELIIRQDMNINKELKITGKGNLINSLLGGFGGYQTLSISRINYASGINSRLTGIFAGIFCFLILVEGVSFLSYLPKFLMGSILFYIGLVFLVDWLYQSFFKISLLDYAVLLTIALAIFFKGQLVGLVVGFLLALCLFVFRYSHVDVFRAILKGSELHSNVERNQSEWQILDQFSDKILILSVKGYLFFGNADEMVNQILELIDSGNSCRIEYLIMDFSHVDNMEISGIMSFMKFLRKANEKNIQIIFCDVKEVTRNEIIRFLKREDLSCHFMHSLNHAIEHCEDHILESFDTVSMAKNEEEKVREIFPALDNTEVFLTFFEKKILPKNTMIYLQGDPATDIYFVTEGMMEVFVTDTSGKEISIKKISSGTIIGEMGFFGKGRRTASVRTISTTTVYCLSEAEFNRMIQTWPHLALNFHQTIIEILSTRLSHASKYIQATSPAVRLAPLVVKKE